MGHPERRKTGGQLPANIVGFARQLRRTGMPVGPGQAIDATRALETVGVERRDDVYWALHSVFVKRAEHRALFSLAFGRFWQDPERPPDPLDLLPPDRVGRHERMPDPGDRRAREAVAERAGEAQPTPRRTTDRSQDPDVGLQYSPLEVLRHRDFEQMSEAEVHEAHVVIARMDLGVERVRTRRFAPDPRGARIDLRATLRESLRGGGASALLRRRRIESRPPAVVALCDISGSMDAYARMMLRFLHALTRHTSNTSTFLFGTRLSNVTRALRHRDVDDALARVGRDVDDWSGGTRIGGSLETFNRLWSRRVLGQGAVVLLITDGLDRDDVALLGRQAERLRKSCRRLIWLNPLLRYEGFEARAGGIREILPWVDDLRTIHNLESMEHLATALGRRGRPASPRRGRAAQRRRHGRAGAAPPSSREAPQRHAEAARLSTG